MRRNNTQKNTKHRTQKKIEIKIYETRKQT